LCYPSIDVNSWVGNIPNGPISIDLSDSSERAASSFGPATTWANIGSDSEVIYDFADLDRRLVCEANFHHSNDKLYLGYSDYFGNGISAKIYEFDPITFTYTDKTGGTYNGYNVWMIDYSPNDALLVAVIGNDSKTNDRICTMKVLTATPDTNFTEVYSNSNVTPGIFNWRQGATRGPWGSDPYYYARIIGHVVTAGIGDRYFGENLTLPLPQQYVESDVGGPSEVRQTIIESIGPLENTDQGDVTMAPEGYHIWSKYNEQAGSPPSAPNPLNVRFSLGQRRLVAFDHGDPDRGYVYFIEYVAGTYHVYRYDITTDARRDLWVSWNENSIGAANPPTPTADCYRQPTCIAAAYDAQYFYLGISNWDDRDAGVTENPSIGYLLLFDNAGTQLASKAMTSGDEKYMMPIAICPGGSGGPPYKLFGCVIQRDEVSGVNRVGKIYGFQYAPFVCDYGFTNFYWGGEISGGFSSSKPFLGFKWNGSNSNTDRRVYFQDTASGMVYYFYYDTHDRNIARGNSIGGAAVDGEHDLATQFLGVKYNATPASEIVYGVSAPDIHGHMLELPAPGRYELWKLHNEYNYTVALADFTDLDVWEGTRHLSAPIDYISGFDKDGDYHFIERQDTVPDYTIYDSREDVVPVPDPSTGKITAIKADLKLYSGEDMIANHVSVKPHVILMGEVKGQGLLRPRPRGATSEEDFDNNTCQLVANQSDSAPHTIILECVRQGQAVPHNHATRAQCRFRGIIYKFEIQTALSQDESPATPQSIHVTDTGNEGLTISPGDFVQIGDDVLNRINPAFASVSWTDNYVTLALINEIGAEYRVGTKVVIYKQTHMQWTDSEYGVTTLQADPGAGSGTGQTIYVESAKFISLNTVLQIEDELDIVEAIEEEPGSSRWKLTCYRGAYRSPTGAHAAGTVVKAFWAPIAADTQYEIFGTGVSLGIYQETGMYWEEKTFLVGDRIKIEAPGLELSEQAKSIATATDETSKLLYGKREYKGPGVKFNRFMGHVLAHELAKRIRTEESYPKWRLEASIEGFKHIFSPPLDTVYVKSRRLFPAEVDAVAGDHIVKCQVTSVSYQLPSAQRSGMTTLQLRACEGHK